MRWSWVIFTDWALCCNKSVEYPQAFFLAQTNQAGGGGGGGDCMSAWLLPWSAL